MATTPTPTQQHELRDQHDQQDHQETMFEDSTGFSDTYSEEGLSSEDTSDDTSENTSENTFENTSEEIAHETPGEMHGEPAHESNHALHASESEQPDSQPAPASTAGPVADAESDSLPMTVFSVDDFAALEERVLKAVSLVRRERQGRVAAEERTSVLESQLLQFEAQLQSQTPAIAKLQQEIDSLRVEREQVRQRIDRLLSQLDALEL
jgi:hypothetical protein